MNDTREYKRNGSEAISMGVNDAGAFQMDVCSGARPSACTQQNETATPKKLLEDM